MDGCKNNSEKSCTIKVGERISSGFTISTILSFKGIENKYNVQRGKDYVNTLCKSLREHAINTINFKKKKTEVISKRTAGIK